MSDEAQGLAARLRDAREYLDLSQQFVADQTGIPRSAISDISRQGLTASRMRRSSPALSSLLIHSRRSLYGT